MNARFRSSSIWQFSEKIVRLPISLLVSILITNYLGASQFGVLTAAYTIILMAVPVASLGLDSLIYKQIGNSEPTDATISIGIAIKVMGFLSVYICIIIYALIFAPAQDWMLVTLGLILFFAAFNPIDILLTVLGHGRTRTLIALTAFTVSTGFRLYMVWIKADVYWFAVAYVLETSIAMFLWLVWARRNKIRLSLDAVDIKGMGTVIWAAFPLFLSNIMISVFAKVDILMISSILGDAPTGQYAVAVNLVALVAIFPATLNSALFPLAMTAKKTSEQAYQAAMLRILTYSHILGLVGALVFFFFGPEIIGLLYTEEFEPSGQVLRILCWSAIFQFFGSFSTLWLINEGLQRYRLYRVTSAMALNVVLNILWIPKFGIQGAAYATLISYFLASILGNAMTANTRPIFWLQLKTIILWHFISQHRVERD